MYSNNDIEIVNQNNGVWELCPKCEEEVFIFKDRVSECPSCQKEIIPCSMCIDCIATKDYCPIWKVYS